MKNSTPQPQLDGFVDKFTPALAAQERVALKKMSARLPGATLLVYDNYHARAIGFAPGERTAEAVLSLAASRFPSTSINQRPRRPAAK
jgi:hypothetical protein